MTRPGYRRSTCSPARKSAPARDAVPVMMPILKGCAGAGFGGAALPPFRAQPASAARSAVPATRVRIRLETKVVLPGAAGGGEARALGAAHQDAMEDRVRIAQRGRSPARSAMMRDAGQRRPSFTRGDRRAPEPRSFDDATLRLPLLHAGLPDQDRPLDAHRR